jgi:hypothetical protein
MSQSGETERDFENALEMNRRMGARPFLARTQRDYARMLLETGGPKDSGKARRLLGEAAKTYRELGIEAEGAHAWTGSAGEAANQAG